MKKILFICPYPPGVAPSQRFRFEQYLDQLRKIGFHIVVRPFFSQRTFALFYQSGNLFAKVHAIARSYLKRLAVLFHLTEFDFIFIHREAAPVGPPIIESVIAKLAGKKIIYDFDDAIWLTDRKDESRLTTLVRCRSKVKAICKWSYKISCGNEYLANYAQQYNANVIINPTTIDHVEVHVPKNINKGGNLEVTVGWTGSYTTLKYLQPLVPVLQSLETQYPYIQFLVIADRDPNLPLKNYRFLPWSLSSEIADLGMMDIGIMPLPSDDWTRGKCGFKALQYMAMSIPAVASAVGANKTIIQHGVEGFLCLTSEEWFDSLEVLVRDPILRARMGALGRQKVVKNYSVGSNQANFLSLFQ